MMRLNRWMAWIDRLCAAVLLLPFLVLALLPAHAMPAAGPDGLTLVLCDGGPPDDAALAGDRCAWAQGVAALPAPAVTPQRGLAVTPAVLPPQSPQTGPAHDPRGVMARGPPAL